MPVMRPRRTGTDQPESQRAQPGRAPDRDACREIVPCNLLHVNGNPGPLGIKLPLDEANDTS